MLTHDVIHGLDVTALGIDRRVPEERLRIVLETITRPNSLKFSGADLDKIELRADDMDWSFGSGTPVSCQAQDRGGPLVLCGRRLRRDGCAVDQPHGSYTCEPTTARPLLQTP